MAKKKRRKKKRFHPFKFLLEILILVLLSAGLFLGYKYTRLDRSQPLDTGAVRNENLSGEELKTQKGYTDIALFGLDSRIGELESGANSDAIMVCSINNQTKEVRLVSVYRDTYLDTGDGDYRKCTEAYAAGGASRAVAMLNRNLDLNISHYVTLNFDALVELVDIFGGVDINLSEGEVQWLNGYLVEGREVLGRECPDVPGPGLQHLNGMQALAYCRIRYIGLDYERTERQREILSQVIAKAKGSDLITLNRVVDALLPKISTDLSVIDMARLASGARKYTVDETKGFPFDKTTMLLEAGDCVIPVDLASNVSQLHDWLYGEEGYLPSGTVSAISANISAETGIYNY